MDLLQYAFFQNALIGSLLVAIAYGIVRTYTVSRRSVFISGGITHVLFGGLGLGFYPGTNPILMAVLFSTPSAFDVEWANRTQNVREDSAIAGIWSPGMTLDVIFIFLTPGYALSLPAYLFGNILTISTVDILRILGLVVLLILIFSLFFRETVYVAFDRDLAVTQDLPVKQIEYTMMCFIVITTILLIRLARIMLLMSLLTLFQITVNLFTSDFKKIMWGSIATDFPGCVSGLVLSYFLNVSPGMLITSSLVVLFLVLKAIKPLLRR